MEKLHIMWHGKIVTKVKPSRSDLAYLEEGKIYEIDKVVGKSVFNGKTKFTIKGIPDQIYLFDDWFEPVFQEDDPPPQEKFETGAKRDSIKSAQWETLPWIGLELIARVNTHGAKKYGFINYQKGLPYRQYYSHIVRHLTRALIFKLGLLKPDDDICSECHPIPWIAELCHASANILMWLETIERVRLGELPESLDDFKNG